ncbi:MAG: hypothetical protein M3O06_11560 [Pseudomonadota bacterium]|nr:hypothetical protein [Pseudomonadota bacterium]
MQDLFDGEPAGNSGSFGLDARQRPLALQCVPSGAANAPPPEECSTMRPIADNRPGPRLGALNCPCAVGAMLAAALGVAACVPRLPTASTTPGAPDRRVATVRDLMEQQVDPSADALWDAVAYIARKGGAEDRQPRTESEWQLIRTRAVTLIEAADLLARPGRRVGGRDVPPAPGELSTAEIERRIVTSPAVFAQFARALKDAGGRALSAIDAKDPQRLLDAGGVIDQACEACHVTYWYPDQNRPGR